jgi:hypothetical protein
LIRLRIELSSLLRGNECKTEKSETCDKERICESVIAGVGVYYRRNVGGVGISAYGTSTVYEVTVTKQSVGNTAIFTVCLEHTVSLTAVVYARVLTLGANAVIVGVVLGSYVGSIAAGTVEGVTVFVLCPSAENVLVVACVK